MSLTFAGSEAELMTWLPWLGWFFAIVGWVLVLHLAYRLKVVAEGLLHELDAITAAVATERLKVRTYLAELDEEDEWERVRDALPT